MFHRKIVTEIGKAGDLKAESTAILLEFNLNVTPYGTDLTKDLPPSDYQPTQEDIEGREDLRNECIFTIDPATAKDLDDAMSCKPLDNGNYEVTFDPNSLVQSFRSFVLIREIVSGRSSHIRRNSLSEGVLSVG